MKIIELYNAYRERRRQKIKAMEEKSKKDWEEHLKWMKAQEARDRRQWSKRCIVEIYHHHDGDNSSWPP